MDILEKLYQNSGLLHVAENVVKFMDNPTVALCRLVNKEFSELLATTWRDRAVQKASEYCKEKFLIGKWKRRRRTQGFEDIDIESCIFDSWPDWKIALHEIKDLRLKDILPVTILLKNFCRDYSRKRYGVSHCYAGGKPPSPLHFAVSESRFLREENNQRAIEILADTSLDFSVRDEKNNTLLHLACLNGSKSMIEVILRIAINKGIDVDNVNLNGHTILHYAGISNRHFYLRIGRLENPEEVLALLETFEKLSVDPNVVARMANVRDRYNNNRPIDYVREYLERHRNSGPAQRLIEKLEKYTSD